MLSGISNKHQWKRNATCGPDKYESVEVIRMDRHALNLPHVPVVFGKRQNRFTLVDDCSG